MFGIRISITVQKDNILKSIIIKLKFQENSKKVNQIHKKKIYYSQNKNVSLKNNNKNTRKLDKLCELIKNKIATGYAATKMKKLQ
jgi:hypothetical protein